ncbi:hypothetical protein D3C71_1642770 [compost metagenome]
MPLAQFAHFAIRIAKLRDDGPCMPHEHLPERRRHRAATGAREERGFGQRLHLLQCLGHRRLRHVEALGCTHEASLALDGVGQAQVAQGDALFPVRHGHHLFL